VIVVGLTSAAPAGYAIVAAAAGRDGHVRERLQRVGSFTIATAHDVEAAVASLAGARPDLAAIEVTVASLAEGVSFGRWAQAFERRGIACTMVPTDDRTRLLGGRDVVAWVRDVHQVALLDSEARAAAIATTALRRAAAEPRARRSAS
jgi:hypothetical protein